jgi:hypothetical protein
MRRAIFLLTVAVGLWFLQAEAVTTDDFRMQTAQDLVDVCSAKPGEPLYEGAMGFCFGFGAGAFQFYQSYTGNMQQEPFVCAPNPTPARSDIVQWFLAWARENPQYMKEPPADAFFRFLAATWPCRR